MAWYDAVGSWIADNPGVVADAAMGAYSIYNQQQASDASQEYMDESLASSQEYFDWWKNNIAPLQQARSLNELHAMGFTQDDEGNWTLSDDVKDMYQTGLGITNQQMQYQQDFMPEQMALYEQGLGLQGAQMDAAMGDIQLYDENRELEQAYYDQALEGVDPATQMARATTDVQSGYDQARDNMRMRASRMGLDPSSGAYAGMAQDMALNEAADIAAARNRYRTAADETNFNRLGQAMNVRQRLGPAQPNVSMPTGLTPSGGMANAGANQPGNAYMQAAQLSGQSAQGYGQGAGYFLGSATQGLGGSNQKRNTGYTNQGAQQLGLQPVMNNSGLGW